MPKLAVLFDAGQAVLSTFDLDEVLQRILAIARDFFHLPNVAILLLDREAEQLCVRSQIGWDPGKDAICLGWHEGITGAAVLKKQPVYAPDVSQDPRYVCAAQSTRSELAIPLMVGDSEGLSSVACISSPAGRRRPCDAGASRDAHTLHSSGRTFPRQPGALVACRS